MTCHPWRSTVVPTRTFLEKTFLLCEEFLKKEPHHIRMSNLYDLERLMDTEFSKQALEDKDLYERIVKHRSVYYSVGYVDYAKLMPNVIDFIPHEGLIPNWKSDYAEMCDHFIYGTKLSFAELIDRMKELQERFRKIKEGLHIHLNPIHLKNTHVSTLPDFVGVQQLHSSCAF